MKKVRLVFLCALLITSTLAAAPRQLVFGVADDTQANAEKAFAGILEHLNKDAELRFKLQAFPTYDQLMTSLLSGKVDVAYVGAVKYVEAHHSHGVVPLVIDGKVSSVIFVPKDSPITSAAQLKGKKFAFGYADSASTYLLPLLLLSKHRLREKDLGESGFLGARQESIIDAVVSGRYDAGALVAPVFEANQTKLRALETSELFPGAPVIVRKETDPKLSAHVKDLFLSYKPVKGQRFGKGAIAATHDDFNKIRFLCQVLFDKRYN